jgi:hypothetical protein
MDGKPFSQPYGFCIACIDTVRRNSRSDRFLAEQSLSWL